MPLFGLNIKTMEKMGDISELKKALETRQSKVRKEIIDAMGFVGGSWVTSTLEDLLKRERNKEVVEGSL